MGESVPADVIGRPREAVAGLKGTPILSKIVEPRDTVLVRFQPVFSPGRVAEITADEFSSFLLLENNHHWSGLHRQRPRMCADMGRLRDAHDGLRYALSAVANVEVRLYEVGFHLKKPQRVAGRNKRADE